MTELPPGIQGVTEPVSSSGFFRFERLVLRLRCRFVPTDHARRFKRAADAPPPAALSPMASDGGPPRSTAGGTGTRRSREGHFRYLVGELRNSHLAPPHRCPCRSREGHFRYLVGELRNTHLAPPHRSLVGSRIPCSDQLTSISS
jgi:hypothetical protein